jgi:hypothetical protein
MPEHPARLEPPCTRNKRFPLVQTRLETGKELQERRKNCSLKPMRMAIEIAQKLSGQGDGKHQEKQARMMHMEWHKDARHSSSSVFLQRSLQQPKYQLSTNVSTTYLRHVLIISRSLR